MITDTRNLALVPFYNPNETVFSSNSVTWVCRSGIFNGAGGSFQEITRIYNILDLYDMSFYLVTVPKRYDARPSHAVFIRDVGRLFNEQAYRTE